MKEEELSWFERRQWKKALKKANRVKKQADDLAEAFRYVHEYEPKEKEQEKR